MLKMQIEAVMLPCLWPLLECLALCLASSMHVSTLQLSTPAAGISEVLSQRAFSEMMRS